MTIKIEIPSNEKGLAVLIGDALAAWGRGEAKAPGLEHTVITSTDQPATQYTGGVTAPAADDHGEYGKVLESAGIAVTSENVHILKRVHGVVEQNLDRDVSLILEMGPYINAGNLQNAELMATKITSALKPKTVDEQAADAMKAGDPNMASNATSADGSNTPHASHIETSLATQSQTQTTASESHAATAGNYQFDQLWLSAGGQDYAGYPIDPDLGVPLDDKNYPLIDTYGVPFDDAWCSRAAEPFYKKGKDEKGKWKAKVGLAGGKDAYLAWHAQRLAELGKPNTDAQTAGHTQHQGGAAANAFTQQQEAPAADSPASDFGLLMGWVANKQGAGLLTVDQLNATYVKCATDVATLMQAGNTQARTAVYNELVAICGA
ncbi:hypothetical protein [Vibrio phage CKB-S1]|nr:hypothetical protein [Vibrio phage CKB-S1]